MADAQPVITTGTNSTTTTPIVTAGLLAPTSAPTTTTSTLVVEDQEMSDQPVVQQVTGGNQGAEDGANVVVPMRPTPRLVRNSSSRPRGRCALCGGPLGRESQGTLDCSSFLPVLQPRPPRNQRDNKGIPPCSADLPIRQPQWSGATPHYGAIHGA